MNDKNTSIKDATREAGADLVEVGGPLEIYQYLHSSGELGDTIRVAPCHCSGDVTRRLFGEAYRTDFIPAGVGSRLEFRH